MYNTVNTFAINGSHDCSVTFIDKEGKLRIFEYERFTKRRYAMFSSMFDDRIGYGSNDMERRNFLSFLKENLYSEDIKLILWHDMSYNDFILFREFFPNANFQFVNHHQSHAASGIHSSNFDECLVFSVDGGGNDDGVVSTTNVFLYKNNNLELIFRGNCDFAQSYNYSSFLLSEIPDKVPGDLSTAGRFMGLSAYGKIREEWLEFFKEFYKKCSIEILCDKLGIPVIKDSLKGQIAYDFARTSQEAFEIELFDFMLPYIEKFNLNVVMTGGCALNVLYNQKLYEYLNTKSLKMFVPCNPNDCGLSHGMFISSFFNLPKQETCFSGIQILDEHKLDLYTNSYEEFSYEKLVSYLKEGKIIGIIKDNSEVGPRALGNRSIICYPAFSDMKDTLNAKVKFREWFRPFAPVCKLENKDIFFENAPECKYMSYAPIVRQEYRDKLSSITHIDNSSRLQTVSEGVMFYDILTEMENQNIIPVILNTSFNIKGFPILTTYEDAFYVLNNTELDLLVCKNRIYKK